MPAGNLIEAIMHSVSRILDELPELLTSIGLRSHGAVPAKPLLHSATEYTKEERKTFALFPAPHSPLPPPVFSREAHTSNQAPGYNTPCGEEKRSCRKHGGEAMVISVPHPRLLIQCNSPQVTRGISAMYLPPPPPHTRTTAYPGVGGGPGPWPCVGQQFVACHWLRPSPPGILSTDRRLTPVRTGNGQGKGSHQIHNAMPFLLK